MALFCSFFSRRARALASPSLLSKMQSSSARPVSCRQAAEIQIAGVDYRILIGVTGRRSPGTLGPPAPGRGIGSVGKAAGQAFRRRPVRPGIEPPSRAMTKKTPRNHRAGLGDMTSPGKSHHYNSRSSSSNSRGIKRRNSIAKPPSKVRTTRPRVCSPMRTSEPIPSAALARSATPEADRSQILAG